MYLTKRETDRLLELLADVDLGRGRTEVEAILSVASIKVPEPVYQGCLLPYLDKIRKMRLARATRRQVADAILAGNFPPYRRHDYQNIMSLLSDYEERWQPDYYDQIKVRFTEADYRIAQSEHVFMLWWEGFGWRDIEWRMGIPYGRALTLYEAACQRIGKSLRSSLPALQFTFLD
jgi:hypothetical protein